MARMSPFKAPRRRLFSALLVSCLGVAVAPGAAGQILRSLGYDLNPQAGPLVFDESGQLYGTAGYVVFRLTPPTGQTGWVERDIAYFGFRDYPGGLTFRGGEIYGAAPHLANGIASGGAVFKLSPPESGEFLWRRRTLYTFKDRPDGTFPSRDPITFDDAGAIYGTTRFGGFRDEGTIYRLTPPPAGQTVWQETIIYNFDRNTGASGPLNGLVRDATGALFGTAFGGGSVFKLTPPTTATGRWTFVILHTFTSSQGSEPSSALTMDSTGALYGTLASNGPYGHGSVYKLTPPAHPGAAWACDILYGFRGGPTDGKEPHGQPALDSHGALYGTTTSGGSLDKGTIYRLTPPGPGETAWSESILRNFLGSEHGDGATPYAALIVRESGSLDAIYGSTLLGGASAEQNSGTVFRYIRAVPGAK